LIFTPPPSLPALSRCRCHERRYAIADAVTFRRLFIDIFSLMAFRFQEMLSAFLLCHARQINLCKPQGRAARRRDMAFAAPLSL